MKTSFQQKLLHHAALFVISVMAFNMLASNAHAIPLAISFRNDVEAGPVQSDSIQIDVPDPGTNPSFYYAFSDDATCDGSDSYTHTFATDSPFIINDESTNGKYICPRLHNDEDGDVYGLASTNPLNIDVTDPTLTEVTAVPTPDDDTTPSYTFNSTEAGTITYGGGCDSGTTSATSGDNIIIYNPLSEGTHPACTIQVADAAGNNSNVLNVSYFYVDLTAPTGAVTIANDVYGPNDALAAITGTGNDEQGMGRVDITIQRDSDSQYWNETAWQATAAPLTVSGTTSWTYTQTYTPEDGVTYTITPEIYDFAGNHQPGTADDYTWDAAAPTVTEITPVPNPTTDNTPNVTINTNEAGTLAITACLASSTAIGSGNTTITLGTFSDGNFNCIAQVTDAAGNTGSVALSPFTVNAAVPTITDISTHVANGTYTVGQVIDIDVAFSENVTSTGEVTVTLETGTTDRTCSFTVTNANVGVCDYTVQAGDTSSSLTVSNIAGTIADQGGASLTNFTPAYNLNEGRSIAIDTTAPTSPSATPTGGTFTTAQSVTLTRASDAASTYYTLDGTTPNNTKTAYTGAISIDGGNGETKTLKAISYDAAGNASSVMTQAYVFVKSATSTDPSPDKLQADYTAGYMTAEGGNPTSTPKTTFNVNYTLQTGGATVVIPAGTEMTKTGGGNFDLTKLDVLDVLTSIQDELTDDTYGAIKFGFPGLKLTFSQPITITIPVGTAHNGKTFKVYFQNEGSDEWDKETTCTVVAGNCTFQTTHATTYTAGSGNPDDSTSGHDDEQYDHYKDKYKSSKNKKIYFMVKSIKSKDKQTFYAMRDLYKQFRSVKRKTVLKLSPNTVDKFKKYEIYRGYGLYREYKEKAGIKE